MKLLFPSHPLKKNLPDPDYDGEIAAARKAGFICQLYSLDDLRAGDENLVLRLCEPSEREGEPILHRGWMMSGAHYALLCKGLLAKGYLPVVQPEEYEQAHYLPNAYPLLGDRTAKAVWTEGKNIEAAWMKYDTWGRPAAIVKDYVKSVKHRWKEACFIPNGTSQARFNEILTAFLDARGKLFEKGIVLRQYHEFVKLGEDLRGQPVHEEYRLFMWHGRLLAATPAIHGPGPFGELNVWEKVAQQFKSAFITMDIARKEDNSWLIVEVGDGGVSGMPSSIDPGLFYETLRERSSLA